MHITINNEGVAALDRILDFAREMSEILDSTVEEKRNGNRVRYKAEFWADELDFETLPTLYKSISFVPDTKEELRDEATFWNTVEDKWGGIPSVQRDKAAFWEEWKQQTYVAPCWQHLNG